MRRWLTIMLLAVGLGAMASMAEATPSCGGTTTTVSSGDAVTGAFLLTPGNCVLASDKLFGDFTVSGAFTGAGAASFSFFSTPGNVTVGFQGALIPNSVGTLTYDVAVDPTLSQGFLIDDFQADFTLNASVLGGFAAATLTSPLGISCARTVNPSGSTCPETVTFATVSDLLVSETITTGNNAIVTGLTNTISQVPEPSVMMLLGSGLVGLGLVARRRA